MKKIVLLAAAMLVTLAGPLLAQHKTVAEYTSIGPVGGFGHNWVSNLYGMNKFNPGGYLGVGLVYSKDPHWGYGGQAEISFEGYKVADANGNISTGTPIYLRVPLRVYYFFGSYGDVIRPKVYLGPSLAVKLGEHDNMRGGDILTSPNIGTFRTFDAGLNAGVGLNVRIKRNVWFNTDLGYTQGLTDAVDDAAGKYNTQQNLTINVGVLFGIK